MQRRQTHVLQSFRAARAYLVRHRVEISLTSLAPQLAALDAVIRTLTDFQGEQDRRSRLSRSGTRSLAHSVRELRQMYMNPVSRLARTHFAPDAALHAAMRIPRDRCPERLAAAARAMADAADTVRVAYLEAGFLPDFTDQLRARADALTAMVDARSVHVARRQASTAGIRDCIRRGQAILFLLDSIVQAAHQEDGALMAEWRTIRRSLHRRRPLGTASTVGPGEDGAGTATTNHANVPTVAWVDTGTARGAPPVGRAA